MPCQDQRFIRLCLTQVERAGKPNFQTIYRFRSDPPNSDKTKYQNKPCPPKKVKAPITPKVRSRGCPNHGHRMFFTLRLPQTTWNVLLANPDTARIMDPLDGIVAMTVPAESLTVMGAAPDPR